MCTCRRIPICLTERRVGWRHGEGVRLCYRQGGSAALWVPLLSEQVCSLKSKDGVSAFECGFVSLYGGGGRSSPGRSLLFVGRVRESPHLLPQDKGGMSAFRMWIRHLAYREWSFLSGMISPVFWTDEGLSSPVAGGSRCQLHYRAAAYDPGLVWPAVAGLPDAAH